MQPPSLLRPGLLLLAGLLLAGALPAVETSGGFSATLSSEQKTAAGLTVLTAAERSALDQLVADDLAEARRENLTALDGTFVARQTDAERKAAGLDRLTTEQLTSLNALVAAALTARPTPLERPRLKDSDVFVKNKPEVHGSVTFGYGWSRGGSARFASFYTEYYDPASRLSLGVGASTFNGSGYWGGGPGGDYAYPGAFYDPWYFSGTATSGVIDLGYHGDNWAASIGYGFTRSDGLMRGDGSCFRLPADGGRGWRRH